MNICSFLFPMDINGMRLLNGTRQHGVRVIKVYVSHHFLRYLFCIFVFCINHLFTYQSLSYAINKLYIMLMGINEMRLLNGKSQHGVIVIKADGSLDIKVQYIVFNFSYLIFCILYYYDHLFFGSILHYAFHELHLCTYLSFSFKYKNSDRLMCN